LFAPPRTLREHAQINQTNDYYESFSQIPKRELLVIRSWFHWISFNKKDKSRSLKFADKAVSDALSNIFRFGVVSFIVTGFNSLKTLVTVLWNVFAYPKIRKKYGLHE